ncbi:hypothetical protein ACET3Z_027977 [Daucus carota]
MQIKREIGTLKLPRHPNVVRLHEDRMNTRMIVCSWMMKNKKMVVTVMRKCKRKGNSRRTTLLMKMTMSYLRIIMSGVSGVQGRVKRTELEDIAGEEQLEEDNELGNEDDLGDFIAEEDLDEHGAPMRRGVTKKKPRQAEGVSLFALQEAHDIFGNVDELL